MTQIKLKATVLRSNPQIIRVMHVSGETDLKDLHRILLLVIGWENDCKYRFQSAKGVKLQNVSLDEALKQTGGLFYYCFGTDFGWQIRLEMKEAGEAKEQVMPAVVRFRGENIPPDCPDVKKLNIIQEAWREYGYYRDIYGYTATSYYRRDDYVFNMQFINLELYDAFCMAPEIKGTGFYCKLKLSQLPSLSQLLADRTVADIKMLTGQLGIRLASSMKKQQLVEETARLLGSEIMVRRCLEEMPLLEYRTFRGFCQNGSFVQADQLDFLDTLLQYGYLAMGSGGQILPCRELIQICKKLLTEEYETSLLKKKQAAACLLAGCELYGLMTVPILTELIQKVYPEQYTAEDIREIWKTFIKSHRSDLELLSDGLLIQSQAISKKQAEGWSKQLEGKKKYIPEQEELEQIACAGLMFDGETGKKLEEWLNRRWSVPEYQLSFCNRMVYWLLHAGRTPEAVVDWLKNTKRKRLNAIQQKECIRYIQTLQPQVRLIGCFGFRKNETVGLTVSGK